MQTSDQVQQSPEERLMNFLGDNGEFPGEQAEDLPSRYPEEQQEDVSAEAQEETAETQEEQQESETQEQRMFRLKHNEQEFEKSEEEVISLAQQGFDYTQKTQRLAEERRAVEAQTQAIKAQEEAIKQAAEFQQVAHKQLAKLTAVDEQLAQYQQVNWQALTDQDPIEAQKLFFAYQQLQNQRGQLAQEVAGAQQEFSRQLQSLQAKRLEENKAILSRDIPNWGPELAKELMTTGKAYGFDDAELSQLSDARAIKLLHDANQWRKLQNSKPSMQNKISAVPPVVKPGSKDGKTVQHAQTKQMRDALRKTGDASLAARLIEKGL